MTNSRNNIFINGLRIYAFHGVMQQERQVGGWFRVSVSVDCDFTKAMQTDSVEDTVSYAELLNIVQQEMAKPSQLLEHVAGRMAKEITSRFAEVTTARITLTKENPPMGANCEGAGVEVEVRNDK